MRPVDPTTHKRFLEYRERHGYFGAQAKALGPDAFAAADAEQRALDAKGEDGRDDQGAPPDLAIRINLRQP